MQILGEYADWWDEQHRISKKALEDFVEAYPNWFAIGLATAAETAMELGSGMVDVLRLGEGVQEGTAAGYAKDALRLLQFAPAVGKLSRFALARVVVNEGGNICTWLAATKALRQVGAKAFAAVEDLAEAGGFKSIKELGGAFVDDLVPILKKLGARVTSLGNPASLEELNAAVKGEKVVLFSVKWAKGGKDVAHTLYAFRDSIGRLLYADRSGAIVKSLAELEKLHPGYGAIGSAKVYGSAALLEGPRILITHGLAVLGIEVRGVLTVDPETAAQTLEIRKQAASSWIPPLQASYHTVVHGEWLSKLAKRYYGNEFKWPIIYEANRQVIGRNPNLIRPGQRLFIPQLPRVRVARPN